MHEIIFDDSFELEKTNDYILSIQVSLDGFSFSVVNPSENRVLILNDLPFKISNEKFFARRLKEWVESEKLVQNEFREINFIIDTEKFTVVPDKFYDYNFKSAIINQLFEIQKEVLIEENTIESINAKLLFTLPESLKEEISSHFENFNLVHPVKTLIANRPQTEKKFPILLFFSEKYFYILLFEDEKLLLANSFKYSHPNDVIFYVLSILKQLKIGIGVTEIFVSGKIEQDSLLMNDLQKYAASVQYMKHKHPPRYNENVFGKIESTYFPLLTI